MQNRQAEVLIQYLVRSGYADVTTDEPQPGRYVNQVNVHWQSLQSLAESSGHHLPI